MRVEAVLCAFYADQGDIADLIASLRTTAEETRMLEQQGSFVEEYLADGGPLDLLESSDGGPGERVEFRGRPVSSERVSAVTLALDASARFLESVQHFCLEDNRGGGGGP